MSDTNQYTLQTFEITTEPMVSPFIQQVLEEGHDHAIRARSAGEKQLQRLIKKHPRLPQLYNYLSAYYMNIGKKERAYELNEEILKKFPDYLQAKINKAHELLTDGDYDGVLEFFPTSFNLKIMYPERDTFHISEVFITSHLAVLYNLETKCYEQVQIHLNIMKELDFDEELVERLELHLAASQLVDKASKKRQKATGKPFPE